ncbi:MAG: hypothetical protein ACLGIB_11255 [Actinomycetota bacterium]
MAIKGKKKSQQRGSQARRRPAQAPRPLTTRSTRPRWYQTTAGQSIAAIATLVAIVVVLVLVNNARNENEARELRQQSLENFTDQMKALLQTVTAPASELSQATQTPAGDLPEGLKEDAERWRDAFTAAQTQAAQLPPAEGTDTAHGLIGQALSLYRGAAEVMVQVAGAQEGTAADLAAVATGQVASADAVWLAAVDVLDAARDDAGLNASGVRAPSEAPPTGEQPDASATVPVPPTEPEHDDGGDQGHDEGGRKAGGGSGGKKKAGDDS